MSKSKQTTIHFEVRKSPRIKQIEKNHKSVGSDVNLQKRSANVQRDTHETICATNKNERKFKQRTTSTHSNINENEIKEEMGSSPKKMPKMDTKKSKRSQNELMSLYARAKSALSPSSVDDIVSRDKECTQLKSLISKQLEERKGSSIYICGPAGTGKSVSVNRVMNELADSYSFKAVNINCMMCRTAASVYEKIVKELNPKEKELDEDNVNTIVKMITKSTKSGKNRKQPNDKMIVLVLDEIDELESQQQVLHTVFQWPSLTNSRLILVGIANSLDFTSRSLSRLGSLTVKPIEEMHFQPYDTKQIVEIIKFRLKNIEKGDSEETLVENVMKPAAIELCARKIASCSGDIRKALDVCRRAIDAVEANHKMDDKHLTVSPLKITNDDGFNPKSPSKMPQTNRCVDVPHIMTILNQVYGNKTLMTSFHHKECLPIQQQIILCSLLLYSNKRKLKELELGKCHELFVKICSKRGISFDDGKNESHFLNMCQLLEAHGYVAVKSAAHLRSAKLSLQVDESEIEHALSDKALLKSILQQSNCFF